MGVSKSQKSSEILMRNRNKNCLKLSGDTNSK